MEGLTEISKSVKYSGHDKTTLLTFNIPGMPKGYNCKFEFDQSGSSAGQSHTLQLFSRLAPSPACSLGRVASSLASLLATSTTTMLGTSLSVALEPSSP